MSCVCILTYTEMSSSLVTSRETSNAKQIIEGPAEGSQVQGIRVGHILDNRSLHVPTSITL
jgi:hypothetical protein